MEALQPISNVETGPRHIPVMQEEVVALLRPQVGVRFLDGTLGGGGHALALLESSAPDSLLLGIDRDAAALSLAACRLAPFAKRCIFVQDNFSNALAVLHSIQWEGVDGVLLDLGFSSLQVEDGERGFSFLRPGPLDMRMDSHQELLAADVINCAKEEELKKIFREFGEEPRAGSFARAVVRARALAPIQTTTDLAQVIDYVAPRSSRFDVRIRT